ncbi:hypothetical protein IZU27_03295 [Treponema socranskii]|uniref:hypothetical protein n=1 Tax=Treponema socranskii TaxID=53419 RepID=UPI003D8E84EF
MKRINKIVPVIGCIFCLLSIAACTSVRPAQTSSSTGKTVAEKRSDVKKTDARTTAENEEYLRSVNNIDVTKKTFEDDKAAIMSIIDELSSIMAGGRYEAWLKFIDEESIRYWSNPKNLERASKMLPVKGLRMNSLRDYFTYIFVPSRKGRKVDEIRYDSKTDVKAVQVSKDTDIIYYYFNKVGDKWLVRIPPID